jgi:hypothetical protein
MLRMRSSNFAAMLRFATFARQTKKGVLFEDVRCFLREGRVLSGQLNSKPSMPPP